MAVVVEPGAEANRLAAVVADLLKRNLVEREERGRGVSGYSFDAALVLEQPSGVQEECTVSFQGTTVRVYPWLKEQPLLTITGSLKTIMGLTRVPLFHGSPVPWSAQATGLLASISSGQLAVEGLPGAFGELLGLIKALSVEERACPFVWC